MRGLVMAGWPRPTAHRLAWLSSTTAWWARDLQGRVHAR